MAAWPGTLPSYVQESGYVEMPQATSIETSMDIGPAKTRGRFTRKITKFQCVLYMTQAQVATFETFWETTLNRGIDFFDWVHPRTRVAASIRFRNPRYQIGSIGAGGTAPVSFVIEIV
jgi:hypothetical protein